MFQLIWVFLQWHWQEPANMTSTKWHDVIKPTLWSLTWWFECILVINLKESRKGTRCVQQEIFFSGAAAMLFWWRLQVKWKAQSYGILCYCIVETMNFPKITAASHNLHKLYDLGSLKIWSFQYNNSASAMFLQWCPYINDITNYLKYNRVTV